MTRACPVDGLLDPINDQLSGEPVVIMLIDGGAAAFSAEAGGQTLVFERTDTVISDTATGSVWTAAGLSTSGELAGEQAPGDTGSNDVLVRLCRRVPRRRIVCRLSALVRLRTEPADNGGMADITRRTQRKVADYLEDGERIEVAVLCEPRGTYGIGMLKTAVAPRVGQAPMNRVQERQKNGQMGLVEKFPSEPCVIAVSARRVFAFRRTGCDSKIRQW